MKIQIDKDEAQSMADESLLTLLLIGQLIRQIEQDIDPDDENFEVMKQTVRNAYLRLANTGGKLLRWFNDMGVDTDPKRAADTVVAAYKRSQGGLS